MVQSKKKILVIRYKFIGDTVLLVPFLRNLRHNEPDAQIDVTVTTLTYPILKDCPYIDNLIFMDTKKRSDSYEMQNTGNDYKKIIKDNAYTHTYVLKRSFSAAWLAFTAGIPERIGFNTDLRGFLLTKRIPYNNKIHESQAFLDVLRTENYEIDSGYPELFKNEETEKKVDEILKQNGLSGKDIVFLHATSGNSNKQWALDNWSEVLEYLANEKNVQVVFSGAEKDRNVYEEIIAKTPDLKVKPVNLCGNLTLEESIELISRAKLMIGCDSGNLHIASAFSVPVIGIYGPMSAEKWGALGENNTLLHSNEKCYPCALKKKCKNGHKCLTSIEPKQVIEAINRYF